MNTNKKDKELFWIIEHDELCWAPGEKKEETKQGLIVQCLTDGEFYQVDKPTAITVHPSCLEGVNDLLSLGEFNEGSLLHTIRTRFAQQQIFSSIGSPILLSVNPYQRLDIFTTKVAQRYRQFSIQSRQA
jgi:myosin heavy subunit